MEKVGAQAGSGWANRQRTRDLTVGKLVDDAQQQGFAFVIAEVGDVARPARCVRAAEAAGVAEIVGSAAARTAAAAPPRTTAHLAERQVARQAQSLARPRLDLVAARGAQQVGVAVYVNAIGWSSPCG